MREASSCGIMRAMEKIREVLEKVIGEFFGAEVSTKVSVEVGVPPEAINNNTQGSETKFRADYATNVAMKLAGVLAKKSGKKQNPRVVAEKIKTEFLKDAEGVGLKGAKIEIAGPGFMNFMLPDGYFVQKLEELGADFEKNISRDDYKGKVVVTEFSDPNPFKVLHIGHLYTSVVGGAISRLVEFAGGEVHRVNFGGDVGLHVAKTLYAAKYIPAENASTVAEFLAKCYVQGTRAYEEDEGARGEIVALNKKIYQIAERGEGNYEGLSEEDKRLAEMYWRGRKLSYEYFEQFYERIGVKFEKFYPESTVAGRGVDEVRAHTPEVYKESEGAIVFKGEDFGLHTRVFINKEGLPTYETKDVGLIFRKYEDFKFDESIVITGNDIVEYMKVVLKSIEQYAPELVKKTRHITHGNVRLPGNEKMSSRKGNFVKAVDVLEMAPLDAIKYSFLKYKIGGDMEFSVEDSVSMAGNSGIYLQYSAVRAKRVLDKLACGRRFTSGTGLDEYEIRLLKKFAEYSEVLREAVREMAPHIICNYLFETAQVFSRFYENCQVAGSERETERKRMVEVFYKIMEHGLGLLGITVPEEM